MTKICLVACASGKTAARAPAQDLYISPLFEKARAYASTRFDAWYILSAKHGLLRPEQEIAPYDQTLNKMPKKARLEWADRVFSEIVTHVERKDVLAFVAGERYRAGLITRLETEGYTVRVPLEGLSIGMQLSWLKKLQDDQTRLRHLDEFYVLVQTLEEGVGGRRILSECTGDMDWPEMGVYFFLETKEYRASDVARNRVVRVGTHTVSKGAKSTLWNRLRTHRGAADRSGNHRGSIFRLHVGAALIKESQGGIEVPSWGSGQISTAQVRVAEASLERRVSDYIGSMSVLWLAIGDEAGPASDRAFIEQNAIALLTGPAGPIDLPTPNWLGRFSAREAIRESGLWNVNYVDDDYDPRFLEIMATYVDATLGRARSPQRSIAPRGWASLKRRGAGLRQYPLFNGE